MPYQAFYMKSPHETDFWLLRQRNGLMIYNKIEWVLGITKLIITIIQIFFRGHLYFFSSTITECTAQDCGIPKAVKDTSMLPSKIDQMKVSHETGSEALDEKLCELWIWTCLDAFLGMRPLFSNAAEISMVCRWGVISVNQASSLRPPPPAVNHWTSVYDFYLISFISL